MLKRIIIISAALILSAANAWALDFSRPSLDGGTLNLSDFRGRVVILDFFASWCRPCKDSVPKLNRLLQNYEAYGLSVLGYSVDEGGRNAVKPWVAVNKVNFPVAVGSAQEAKDIAGVSNLPTTLVIDPQGNIIRSFEGVTGEDTLLAVIKPYLNNNPPPQPSSAKVYRRQDNERRFRQVWSADNEVYQGKRGVMITIQVDVADMPVAQGAWVQLNLSPEAQDSSGRLRSVGPVKQSYILLTDAALDLYYAFIPCADLPPMPDNAVLRSWMVLLDHNQKAVETSQEIIISRPCRRPLSR
ncbi:MAG: TlpA family protein disulfide reductase [Desulfarculales bacterium]|jgi:peroxiredoxin|nr:TlpA family protein disulfide reductase [Desulfarculales bacterium]